MENWLKFIAGEARNCLIPRFIFLRFMALIYLFTFMSIHGQVGGLIGSEGILPASTFFDNLGEMGSFLTYPSLFWIHAGDGFLKFSAFAGLFLSIMLFLGFYQKLACGLLWFLLLSFISAGQNFFGHISDHLLLEAGFLAIFFAPSQRKFGRPLLEKEPSMVWIWLYRLLLFKVLFSSGIDRISENAELWRQMSFLNTHFLTQPLPSFISWHVHMFKVGFHEFCAWLITFVELLVPFYIFSPRKIRVVAFAFILIEQIFLLVTCNFGTYNLTIIALSLLLLENTHFGVSREEEAAHHHKQEGENKNLLWKIAPIVLILLMVLSIRPLAGSPSGNPLIKASQIFGFGYVYHTWTSFGGHENRREIIVEGSQDGKVWKEYIFKFKPQIPTHLTAAIAPHIPRLDWQMALAADQAYENSPWMQNLFIRLLEASPAVLSLFEVNPFQDKPPLNIRAKLKVYKPMDLVMRDIHINNKKQIMWWRAEGNTLFTPDVLHLKK